MERIPHIMKEILSTKQPSNFLFFDTETEGEKLTLKVPVERQRFWFGVALAYRYVNGVKTRQADCCFHTISEFWTFVKSRLDKSRPLYVFAHNLGFDLTIVDFWMLSQLLGITVTYAVLEDLPTFLECSWHGCKITFVDTLNYWRASLALLGKSFGVEKLTMPTRNNPMDQWEKYCRRDVEVISAAISGLVDYLTQNNIGPFALTAPSIAIKAYKHGFMDYEIFVHDNIQAIELERESYYGGLVSCYYIGDLVGKRVHHYDVNSLYPYCMLGDFPTKLVDVHYDISPRQLLKVMRKHGAAARVLIRTDDSVYPFKHRKKLLEVKGTFTTSLCGPELKEALVRDDVISVEYAAEYEMAPIFCRFIEHFWAERIRYKKEGAEVKQIFCKLLMNQLYGKFGQRGYEWTELNNRAIDIIYLERNLPVPECYKHNGFQPSIMWKQVPWFIIGSDDPVDVKNVGGLVQCRVSMGEHYESVPIIAAYVTAYARSYLHYLIDIAGKRNVYYCDTDSLFVTTTGKRALEYKGVIDNNKIGYLKHEGSYSNCSFYGPKDYSTDTKTVLKGVRPTAKHLGNNRYEQIQFEGLKGVFRREPLAYIDVSTINKHIRRIYTKGVVGSDGWVSPFTMPCLLPD